MGGRLGRDGPGSRDGSPSKGSGVRVEDRGSWLVRDPRLVLPPLPPHHVPRPRLVAALDDAADLPLTVLAAGAGAGKTVLLTEWARRTQDPLVWMAPSPADWHPGRFWRLLKGGLSRCGDLGMNVGNLIRANTANSEDIDFVEYLAGGVPSGTRLTLIIDNAHMIKAAEILSFLDRLVAGGDGPIRVVLGARSDPLLPLHRYRLAGRIRELRAADLAMTSDEIEALLRAHDVELEGESLRRFVARIEGWAAGVRLAALRMQGSDRPSDFVTEMTLDQGSIGEYLLEEVFSHQPLEVRQMLVRTSFLDVVSGPVASAVTGLPQCGDMLMDLARSNSFVVAIDHTFTHFRYHQLFRDFLRYLLDRETDPDRATLASRGADWYESEGDVLGAMSIAVQGGAHHRIADLMTRGGLAAAFAARVDLSSWAALVPAPAALEGVAAFAVHAVTASRAEAVRALQEWRPPPEVEGDRELSATWAFAEIILAQKAGDPRRVHLAATRLLEGSVSAGHALPGSLRCCLLLADATAQFWLGRIEQALGAVSECLEGRGQLIDRALEADALALIALLETYSGRTQQGALAAAEAESLVETEGLDPPAALGLAKGLRALVGAQIDPADDAFQQVRVRPVLGVDPGFKSLQLCGRAAILALRRRDAQARILLQDPDLMVSLPLIRVHRDVHRASIETTAGRPQAALEILQGYPAGSELATDKGHEGMPGVTAAAQAYAHAALGQFREAEACVGAVFTSPRPEIGRYQFIEATVCAACIALQQGREGRSTELLVRALQIATPDVTLPLVARSEVLGPLVARHPAVAGEWPACLPVPEPAISATTSAARDGWIPEPLTVRERSVLRLLATSMSTIEIAEEMCVSVNTVKTHVAAIYRKLATSKRREAIFKARELELL